MSMNPIDVLSIKEFEPHDMSSAFYSSNIPDHITNHKNAISKPHKHDFYLTVLFTKGFGTHEIDFKVYDIVPGSLFLLRPGQLHNWKLTDDIDGFIFFHSDDFYELEYVNRNMQGFPFFYSSQNPSILNLDKNHTKRISTVFNSINQEFINNDLYRKQKVISLLDLLYIELSRLYMASNEVEVFKSSSYTSKLWDLEKLINKHFKQEKSPTAYAHMLHITPKHLNRIVKATLNKTSMDLITDRVILEAKRMLVHSSDTFSNIASNLGYEDYAYFSRVFKHKTGSTPSAFKNDYL